MRETHHFKDTKNKIVGPTCLKVGGKEIYSFQKSRTAKKIHICQKHKDRKSLNCSEKKKHTVVFVQTLSKDKPQQEVMGMMATAIVGSNLLGTLAIQEIYSSWELVHCTVFSNL